MHFGVKHRTVYRYDVPVRLAPHTLRLTPRPGQGRLLAHTLRVDPAPTQRRTVEDPYGNLVTQLEFDTACYELSVDSELEFQTESPPEPTVSLPPLPWSNPGEATSVDPSVRAFAEGLFAEAGHTPLAFLDHLANTLHTRIGHEVRTSGDANDAAWTLSSGRGACRDLAVLFMEAARSLGMQSRFVSGYQARAQSGSSQRYLHAWPEVLLPGGGFRGWDPTHGRRITEEHLALCAAPTQAMTMPIEGGFYFDGASVTSTLDFSLQIAAGP